MLVLGDYWIYALVVVALGIGVVTVLAGIAFVRRSAWARFTLEVVSWIAVIGIPIVSWYQATIRNAALEMHRPETDRLAQGLRPWGLGTWISLIFWIALVGILRSRTVRAAFESERISGHEA